jgi:thiamine biosynthesis lipoprotein
VGRAESEASFREKAQAVHDELLVYHQLFDIYNDYEGTANLKTVNDNAGIAPVSVDRKIVDLLLDCKKYHTLTGGKVNVAMGSVLHLWHEARNDGLDNPAAAYLPDNEKLAEAAKHCNFDDVIIDEAASTVYITDPDLRLDVGAIAKGWATQRAAENAPTGLLISVGGNVCATGPKDENGTPWVVGVTNPDGGDYLHTIYTANSSVVTSGDYQRTYMVEGKLYHHIIDPVTLYPSEHWRTVTIVCDDSGLADALSTALFLLPLEDGQALLEQTGAEAMWVDAAGQNFYSPGFEALIRT